MFVGYHLSDPRNDLSIISLKDQTPSSKGQFFYYKADENRDWFPTGHYRGTGPLLVEKQVIVHKGDAFPIEQAAVARFREGGEVEGHHHKTAIETFTGLKGKCIFEIVKPDGLREVLRMEPGNHLIMGPGTTHAVRNDEEEDCLLLTTMIAAEGSQMSAAATGSHSFIKKKKNNFVYKNSLENSLLYSSDNARRRLRRESEG